MMLERLAEIEARFEGVEKALADPKVIRDRNMLQKYSREHKEYLPIVNAYREYRAILGQIGENEELLSDPDPEIRELAEEELGELKGRLEELTAEVKILLLPKDPDEEKNALLEIRAGTGGDEAALFVADLFRMYTRFIEQKGWSIEILSSNPTGIGGFKEVISMVSAPRAYGTLKYESGVHRVQRIPLTEAQGRIHTSTVTVAVLPEAEDVELHIEPKDLRIDVFRSSGPGGQSVNTTDSAVRITHIPTSLVVTCQDEKSQHKNKAKALKVLRARLLDIERQKQEDEIARARRSQVGTGERSERIRTYNFPQNRVTDHRLGLTLHRLEAILEGDLEEIVSQAQAHFRAEALKGESLEGGAN